MPLHILPENRVAQQNYELGMGMTSGLENLAQSKMQQIQQQYQRRQLASALEPLGLGKYANLPEPLLQEVVKEHLLRYGIGPNMEGKQGGLGQQGGLPGQGNSMTPGSNLGADIGQRRLSAHDILAEKRHQEDLALRKSQHEQKFGLQKQQYEEGKERQAAEFEQKKKIQQPKTESEIQTLIAPIRTDMEIRRISRDIKKVLSDPKSKLTFGAGWLQKNPQLLTEDEKKLKGLYAALRNAQAERSKIGGTVQGLKNIEEEKPNLDLGRNESLRRTERIDKEAGHRIKGAQKNPEIAQYLKTRIHEPEEQESTEGKYVNDLPNPEDYPEGFEIQDTSTGGWLKRYGKEWKPTGRK